MICWLWVGSFAIATVAVIALALKLNADATVKKSLTVHPLDRHLNTRRLV